MGPVGSPIAHLGVQLTDTAYALVIMRLEFNVVAAVRDALGDGPVVRGLHSVGTPLRDGQPTSRVCGSRSEAMKGQGSRRGGTLPDTTAPLNRSRGSAATIL